LSALPQSLPLALSAAFYPPALVVLVLLLTGGADGWVDIALGLLLLALAIWAWRRRSRAPADDGSAPSRSPGRIGRWSGRATTSERWAFVLGLAMFLPSPLYLLAVEGVADSGDSTTSNVAAVLVCAAIVLVLIEIPLLALAGAVDAIVRGVDALT
jgi:LPXTG-motif cell wall-anchored protein